MPTPPTIASLILAASLLATPTVAADILGPTPPTALVARATAAGQLSLAWNASSSAVGVTAYRIYHVEADGSTSPVAEIPGSELSWNETGLAAGVTLTYVVTAVDLLGESAPSEPASATTWTLPSAPRGLSVASGPGLVGEATIAWEAPETDGGAPIFAYLVYRDGALAAIVEGEARSYTDAGLTPLTAYSYAIAAVNAVGEGPSTEPVCGMASPWPAELACPGL